MIWNSLKITAIPTLIAASVLGTAVLAQQGRTQASAGRFRATGRFIPTSRGRRTGAAEEEGVGERSAEELKIRVKELRALQQLKRQKMTCAHP